MASSPLSELRELNAAMRDLETREVDFLSRERRAHGSWSAASSRQGSPQAPGPSSRLSTADDILRGTRSSHSTVYTGANTNSYHATSTLHDNYVQGVSGHSQFTNQGAQQAPSQVNASFQSQMDNNLSFTHVPGSVPPKATARSFSLETPMRPTTAGGYQAPYTVAGEHAGAGYSGGTGPGTGINTELGFVPYRAPVTTASHLYSHNAHHSTNQNNMTQYTNSNIDVGRTDGVPPGTSIAGSPNGNSLLSALKVLQDKIRILEQERDESIAEKNGLSQELNGLRQQVKDALAKEITGSQSRQEAANAEVSSLRADVDQLRQRHAQLQSEGRRVAEEGQQAQSELEHLRQLAPQTEGERRQVEQQLLSIEQKINQDNRESSQRLHELEAITRNFQSSLSAAENKMKLLQAALAEEKSYRVAAEEDKARVDETVQSVLNLNETLVSKLYSSMQRAQDKPNVVVKTVRRKIKAKVDSGLKKKKRVVQSSIRTGGGYIINPQAPRRLPVRKAGSSKKMARSSSQDYVDLMLNNTPVRVPRMGQPSTHGTAAEAVVVEEDLDNLGAVVEALEAEKAVMTRDYEALLHKLQHTSRDEAPGSPAQLDLAIRGMIDRITEKEKQLATLKELQSRSSPAPKKKKKRVIRKA